VELKATRFDLDGHVATVWLHRPHRHNAWTGRMHTEYRWILAQLEADPDVRAVVVTGTPPAFCVGADSDALAGHADRGGYDAGLPTDPATPGYGVRPEFDHDMAFHYGLRFPVIAAVNGACAGVALALALFCDLRFVAADAKLTTAAPKLGLPAEYGMSWVLPRLVGTTRAADLLLSGRVVTGAETADWGLWNGVGDDGARTLRLAQDYAATLAMAVGPNAARTTKRQLYDDLLSHDVGAAVDTAGRLLDAAMGTPEYREGVAALRERRRPRFS
jgi:enoyl-CoA hydratase/carnithine racemase